MPPMKIIQQDRMPLRLALLTLLLVLPSLLCPPKGVAASGTVIAWGGNSNGQTNVPLDLTNAVAVAAGEIQSLAIRRDGTLAAWGGDSTSLTNVPAGISNVVQVAGGGTHGLVLRADGSVVGWGDNYYPDTNSPTGQATPPADLANAVGIAAGWAHSVALRYDQTVVAWGCNNHGQTNVPANLGPVMAVAAGDWFSAALRKDGKVVAWGDNSVGQTNVPAGLSNVVALSARGSTVLALQQNGQVVAWGGGSAGQTNVPSDLTNAVAIAAGGMFELALRDDGRVTAWGDNGAGEVDAAAGLAQVTALDAGGAHGVALLGNGAPQVTLQPRNQAAAVGTNVTFVVKAVGNPLLSYQWRKDGLDLTNSINLSGARTTALSLSNLAGADAGRYSLVISNLSGIVTSTVAVLTLLTSSAADSFNPNANNTVNTLALQEDGKVLVGGSFTTLGGQSRIGLGRVGADGTLDTSFNTGASTASATVFSLAVQSDHKILVSGPFFSFGGQMRTNLARLNADGSLDTAFTTAISGLVFAWALQEDGRVVMGGNFARLGGETHQNIGRLNTDGSPDTAFVPEANGSVSSVAVQPDGKILVGGNFTTLNGTNCNFLGRLNADGTLDTNFTAGADNAVYCLALQAGGKILVGGSFITLNGQSRNGLGRLNPDGSLDTTFDPGANGTVNSLVVQTDGRILAGGSFTTLGGQTRSYIGRVNADGSLDADFTAGADGTVNALAVQADGGIVVGGAFTTLGGQPRNRIGRLNNTLPATESLNSDGSTITWLRGGTGPEVSRVTFETSTNGTDWISLGAGARILGGWQAAGLSLPAKATLRARGFCPSGRYDGSGSIVEKSLGPPALDLQPGTVTGLTNTVIGLSVSAAGTPPLAYRWYMNGIAITDATNAGFTIQSAAAADTGIYQVVVTNVLGSITSAAATVTVVYPPLADALNPGANGIVYALAVQPDGKILAGGGFTTLGGQTRNSLGRLNADGSLDSNFNPAASGLSASVKSLALQADGRILVGGTFTTLGGLARPYLGRLNVDGNVDTTFNPSPDGPVYAVMVQADGKILVGGSFTLLGGQACTNLGRFNADGTLDTAFSPGPSGTVYTVALQPDGKIVVGGNFNTLGGQPRNYIGRLNPDGGLDNDFDPGANSNVFALALQADGKILVGGDFIMLGGQRRAYLVRLNTDGTLDLTFSPTASGTVYALVLQADGGIVVGGSFSTLCGATRPGIGRINANGSLDVTFKPAGSGTLYTLAAQADGRLVVGGSFGTLGGQTRNCIARLINTLPATESGTIDNSTFTWLRGRTGPEVWRTTLEVCTNGMDWNSLGSCTRIPGGWQRTSLASPVNTTIRARGYVVGGPGNGSAFFVETAVGAPLISSQPATAANFTNTAMGFSVVAIGTQPLAYQWYKNGAPIAEATNSTYTIPSSAPSDAGSYQVVLTNGFGAVTSVVTALTILGPALLDPFNPAVAGLGPAINAFAVQPDGKILAGGSFTNMCGQTHSNLARLNTDGTADGTFNAAVSGLSPFVAALALQPDGKVLVGGTFTSLNGQSRNYLGRLNANGSLDTGFNPGAGGDLYTLAVQPDGKIVVGGFFITLGGQTRNRIARLNADGSLDADFNPGAGGPVYCVALQPDGKILVGGNFSSLGGQTRSNLGRLNADGSLDTTFNPGASGYVYSLAVQADGKILAGGTMTFIAGLPCTRLGRLNADGSRDTSFNATANNTVYSMVVQANGKILVGGQFTTLTGQTNSYLGRMNADGSADATFNPGASSFVYSLAVQPDGKVLAGGSFSTLGGQPRKCIGRLNNTEPATESLSFNSSAVTWLRGGSGPEVWRTIFDVCTNGTDWNSLGGGTRTPGGWQQTGLSLPTNATIRTRGFCTSGENNASSWFVETLVGAPFITCQPTNIANFTNSVMGFSVAAAGTQPIAYQWYKNGGVITDATNLAYTIQSSAAGDAGNFRVVASNSFGMVTSAVAILTILNPVSADAFNPGAGGVSFPSVSSFAVQPDGKIMAGGSFSTLAGQSCSNLGRLNADGSLEIALNANAPAPYLPWVYSLALQPDGKILVGGAFTMLAGQPRTYLGRINGDGSLDTAFNPHIPGAGQGVLALAVQPDGKILVGGNFTALAGQPRSNLGRLNANGSLDPDFNPQANNLVYSLAVQPDGMILVAGAFTGLGGWNHGRVARLYPDGTLDMSFNPVANDTVRCVAVQPDGRILLGGFFTTLASQSRTNLGRLNADGTLDTGFNPGTGGVSSPSVHSLALQTDGKILVGGYFATLGGQTCNHLGRLNPNGSLDPTFNPTPNLTVSSVAVQADGKILVGGAFTNLAGQTRNYVGRLANTEPATQSLSFDGSTVTWLRGATGPEAWRTTFDACTNGTDWISLGAGTRITSGWQQTGLSLPAGATIRARGFCLGGAFDGSSWYVETGLGRAAISQQPDSRTNNAGTITQFLVQGAGTSPLSCQWRKGGVLLSDSGNISGSQTATLTLTNVLGADAGSYSVIITNSSGSVTSQVATLIVVDPFISAQPVSQTVNAGATLLFSATAVGTESLRYQWRRNGLNVAGGTDALLTLTNVQWADAGGFDLLVSNSFGMVTSVVATLSVNGPVIPVNDGSFGQHTNGFGFNVGCMPGEAVVIEASTNLVDWVPVQTNLVTSEGIFLFVDRDKSIYQRRFYRARLYAGALPGPAIDLSTGALSFPTNPFGFDLCGVAGQTAVIEASTNLLIWMPLATNRLGTDPLYFSDPASTNLSQRFYRAVLVP